MPNIATLFLLLLGSLFAIAGVILGISRRAQDEVARILSIAFGYPTGQSRPYIKFSAHRALMQTSAALTLIGIVIAVALPILGAEQGATTITKVDTIRLSRTDTIYVPTLQADSARRLALAMLARDSMLDKSRAYSDSLLRSLGLVQRVLIDSIGRISRHVAGVELGFKSWTAEQLRLTQEKPKPPPLAHGIPTDTTARYKRILASQHPALIRAESLSNMIARMPHPVYVYIRHRAAKDTLPSQLGTFTNGRFADTLRLGHFATVCLTAPPADFTVTAQEGTCSKQPILPGRDTRWRWTVTPTDSGHRLLELRVTSLIDSTPYAFFDTTYSLIVTALPEPWFAKVMRLLKTTEGVLTLLGAVVTAFSVLALAVRKLSKRKSPS